MTIYKNGYVCCERKKGCKRIAVFDDDRAIREEISRLIQKQAPEADIVAYQSGEAMTNAGENFDISFLDVEMGKVSGMDIARHIREKEESLTQRSILIFVTGYREIWRRRLM